MRRSLARALARAASLLRVLQLAVLAVAVLGAIGLPDAHAERLQGDVVVRAGAELDTNPERLAGVSTARGAARGALQGRSSLRVGGVTLTHQGLALGKVFPSGGGGDTLTLDHGLRVSSWIGRTVLPSLSVRHVERIEPEGPDRFRLLQPRAGLQTWAGPVDLGARLQWSELWWFADRRLDARGPDVGFTAGLTPEESLRVSVDFERSWRHVDEPRDDASARRDRSVAVAGGLEWRPGLHVLDTRVERAWQESNVPERVYQRWSVSGGWTTALSERWFLRTSATLRWLTYREALLVEEGLFVEDENRSTIHAALSGPTPLATVDWELRHVSAFRLSDVDVLGRWTRHQIGCLLVWRPSLGERTGR